MSGPKTHPRNFQAMRSDRVMAMAQHAFSRPFGSKKEAIDALSMLPIDRQHALPKNAPKAKVRKPSAFNNELRGGVAVPGSDKLSEASEAVVKRYARATTGLDAVSKAQALTLMAKFGPTDVAKASGEALQKSGLRKQDGPLKVEVRKEYERVMGAPPQRRMTKAAMQERLGHSTTAADRFEAKFGHAPPGSLRNNPAALDRWTNGPFTKAPAPPGAYGPVGSAADRSGSGDAHATRAASVPGKGQTPMQPPVQLLPSQYYVERASRGNKHNYFVMYKAGFFHGGTYAIGGVTARELKGAMAVSDIKMNPLHKDKVTTKALYAQIANDFGKPALPQKLLQNGDIMRINVKRPTPILETPAAAPKGMSGKVKAGALGVAAVGAAALLAANRARAEGTSQTGAALTAVKESGTSAVATTAAQTAATYGLMRATGMTAARAVPGINALMMAGGAVHGAIKAQPGSRLAGAARGAWDMSLPGMATNVAKDTYGAIKGRVQGNVGAYGSSAAAAKDAERMPIQHRAASAIAAHPAYKDTWTDSRGRTFTRHDMSVRTAKG